MLWIWKPLERYARDPIHCIWKPLERYAGQGPNPLHLEATREICQGPNPLHLEATALKLSLLEGHISTFGSKLVPFCPAFSSYSPTVCKFVILYTIKSIFQTIIVRVLTWRALL